MPKLTKRAIESLPIRSGDYVQFDSDLPGFGVRVMPSGKRFFLIQYRRDGHTRRVMLGQFGPVTAENARNQALRLLGQIKGAGADPAAERDAERSGATLTQLSQRFLEQHVIVRCKVTTQGEYTRSVELFINPFFKYQRVKSITTADVSAFHGGLSHIPYQANRALGVLSKMLSLAETWGLRPRHSNPCQDIEKYPETKRERFLSLAEIRSLGAALDDYEKLNTESFFAVAAYRLLLLTGCRSSEVQNLTWDDVRLEEAELRLPDSKTGAKIVHIGVPAVDLLKTLPRLRGNPYVIPGKLPGAHLTDFQRPWQKIRKSAGLIDVRIHDLRHTFASGGVALGEGLPMIGKLLGHSQVQTTARYAHLASEPVKAAATKIARSFAAALRGDEAAPTLTPRSSANNTLASLNIADFRQAMRLIVEAPELNGGAPTFVGTRLLVLPIAELIVAGADLSDLQTDFPRLTEEMVGAALLYARIGSLCMTNIGGDPAGRTVLAHDQVNSARCR